MDGPSLAPILIPVIGTLLLIAWLALVFWAGRHAERPAVAVRSDAVRSDAVRSDADSR